MDKLSKIDRLSLDHILKIIDYTLPNIKDEMLHVYLLDVYLILDDFKKGRSK